MNMFLEWYTIGDIETEITFFRKVSCIFQYGYLLVLETWIQLPIYLF